MSFFFLSLLTPFVITLLVYWFFHTLPVFLSSYLFPCRVGRSWLTHIANRGDQVALPAPPPPPPPPVTPLLLPPSLNSLTCLTRVHLSAVRLKAVIQSVRAVKAGSCGHEANTSAATVCVWVTLQVHLNVHMFSVNVHLQKSQNLKAKKWLKLTETSSWRMLVSSSDLLWITKLISAKF